MSVPPPPWVYRPMPMPVEATPYFPSCVFNFRLLPVFCDRIRPFSLFPKCPRSSNFVGEHCPVSFPHFCVSLFSISTFTSARLCSFLSPEFRATFSGCKLLAPPCSPPPQFSPRGPLWGATSTTLCIIPALAQVSIRCCALCLTLVKPRCQ